MQVRRQKGLPPSPGKSWLLASLADDEGYAMLATSD